MKSLFAHFALAAALATSFVAESATAQSPAANKALAPSAEAVTVVIQVTMLPGAQPEAAAAAMNDMRALVRKQPGFLGEEFLKNVNAANSPAYVHVMHWAAMNFWEGVFTSPDFAKISASGVKQYTVTASAFRPVK